MTTARFLLMLVSPLALLCLLDGCRLAPPQGGKASALSSSTSKIPPDFADVASVAGLNYRWTIAGPRPLTIRQSMGCGCAFLDYDGDGNLDVLLVGEDHVALYKGDGRGHFTDVSHATGLDRLRGDFRGVAVGDYDNDGYDDLYLSGYDTGLLLHNEGGKAFRNATASSGLKAQPWGTSAAWADINNDGKLDLYVANYVEFGPKTNPQLCSQRGITTGCGPQLYKGLRGVLYQNLGGGKFRDVTQAWGARQVAGYGLGVAAADYDGSGRQSLAVANDQAPGDLLVNQGKSFLNEGKQSGTAFDAMGNVHAGMGIDWGDYDNDGKLDLVITTFQHEAKCVYHNEQPFFTEKSASLELNSPAPYISFGAKFFDYDNDGWLDLIITSGSVYDNIHDVDKSETYREPTQLFRNVSGTRFEDVTDRLDAQAARPVVGRGLAIGDYDNDGRVDVLVVDGEGAPLLLHNETPGAGHWLTLALEGTRSNRDGLGALVTVTAGGMKQARLCQTDGSYLSASDKRVHVGIGAATSATVSIHWPSGHIDQYGQVRADQFLTAREGSSQLLPRRL